MTLHRLGCSDVSVNDILVMCKYSHARALAHALVSMYRRCGPIIAPKLTMVARQVSNCLYFSCRVLSSHEHNREHCHIEARDLLKSFHKLVE